MDDLEAYFWVKSYYFMPIIEGFDVLRVVIRDEGWVEVGHFGEEGEQSVDVLGGDKGREVVGGAMGWAMMFEAMPSSIEKTEEIENDLGV